MINKNVLITGASSGIGYQLALRLLAEEYNVIVGSRNIKDDFGKKFQDYSKVYPVNVDVTKENSIKKMFENIKNNFAKLDFLINNAGFVEPTGILETTLKNWNRTINTNLRGTFLCTKYAINLMKQNGGKIINISSTAGLTPRPGWSAYAAAKSGIIGFSQAIAEELRIYNIKMFIICPGRTATPLRRILAPNEDPTSIMQPNEVVNIIKYCMTNEGDVLEGQPILVRQRY